MYDEDFSLCLSCGFCDVCAELSGGEPVAYECDAYSPREEQWVNVADHQERSRPKSPQPS